MRIDFNVKKNKRETKYITPEGFEVERVSSYKKVLGDTWSKYSIGMYKGREYAFSVLSQTPELLNTQEGYKKAFNSKTRESSEEGKNRGTLFHEEIEMALKEEDILQGLELLLNMPLVGDNGEFESVSNPFSQPLIDLLKQGWELYSNELSFSAVGNEISYGGTIDTVLCKKDKGQVTHLLLLDYKSSQKTKEERYDDTYLEYALQLAAYSPALFTLGTPYSVKKENISLCILWEDAEQTHFTYNEIQDFYELFIEGIKYQTLVKQRTLDIKEKRGQSC